MEKYCDDCEKIVSLTEDGYCKECGKHSDNMTDEYPSLDPESFEMFN